ncbi:MAG TPA: hypothetical protein DIW23_07230 [Anaerolineae bacterium]|nr:hypothetical protein [Anaerolineae bacterium]
MANLKRQIRRNKETLARIEAKIDALLSNAGIDIETFNKNHEARIREQVFDEVDEVEPVTGELPPVHPQPEVKPEPVVPSSDVPPAGELQGQEPDVKPEPSEKEEKEKKKNK